MGGLLEDLLRSSINTMLSQAKGITARPTSSTWISAWAAKITTSSCAARLEERVPSLRGRVSRIYEKDGKLIVKGADTLSGSSGWDQGGKPGRARDRRCSRAMPPRRWRRC